MKMISVLPAALAALAAAYILIGAWLNHAFGADPSRRTPAAERGEGAHPLRLTLSRAAAALGAGALAVATSSAQMEVSAAELAAMLSGAVLGGIIVYGALFMSVRHEGTALYTMIRENDGRGETLFFALAACYLYAAAAGFAAQLASAGLMAAVQLLCGAALPRAATVTAVLALGLIFSFTPEDRGRRAGGWLMAALVAAYTAALLLGMPAGQEETIPWVLPGTKASGLLAEAGFGAYLALFTLPGAEAAQIVSERHIRPVALGGALAAALVCLTAHLAAHAGVMGSLAASLGCGEAAVRAGFSLAACAMSLHTMQQAMRGVRALAEEWRAPAFPGMKARIGLADIVPFACLALSAGLALYGSPLMMLALTEAALYVGLCVCHLVFRWLRQIGRRHMMMFILCLALFAMIVGTFTAVL